MKDEIVLENIGIRQREAIEAVYKAVIKERGVKAVFLKGSIARGQSDQHSDVDLYCLVEKEFVSNFLDKRVDILDKYRPIIYFSEANFVCPQIVAVFDNGLHFDLYTTSDITSSTDSIKALYDPKGLLSDYKQIKDENRENLVATKINSISFTLLEFEAAYKRNDYLWATRLGHHMTGDISVILSYLYDKEKPYLGLKRLYKNLDVKLLRKLTKAVDLVKPSTILSGVKSITRLLDDQLNLLPKEVLEKVNLDFYKFMKNKINSIES